MKARFWQLINGSWVRLTLRVGERLSWHRAERHGEGHSYDCIAWSNDGDAVRRETISGGTDCDGEISTEYVDICPIDRLDAISAFHENAVESDWFNGAVIRRPDFQEYEPTRVYDQYAQLANY